MVASTGVEVAGIGAEVAAMGVVALALYCVVESTVCSTPLNEENASVTVTTSPLAEVRRKERGKAKPEAGLGAVYSQYPQPGIIPGKRVHAEPASLISIDDVVEVPSITVTASQ